MALVTVEGIFRDGKVALAETPAGVDGETRVLVTSLPAPGTVPGADRTISESTPREAASDRVTLRAVDAVAAHGLSFWDALIWAAARENGVGTIATEEFQHGREIEGVRFVNPFLGAR